MGFSVLSSSSLEGNSVRVKEAITTLPMMRNYVPTEATCLQAGGTENVGGHHQKRNNDTNFIGPAHPVCSASAPNWSQRGAVVPTRSCSFYLIKR